MSSQVQQVVARFRAFPPLLRLAFLAAVVIIAFVLVNDYAWSSARRMNEEADTIARTLDRARATRADLRREMENVVIARGPVRLPVDENDGTQAMADAVNEIVRSRSNIAGYSYDSGSVTRMPPTALVGVLPGDRRGARVTGEVKFDATPDDAMAVIAEIESHPAINAISRVQLVRAANRRVAVTLTVETWVIASVTDARGRGGL